MVANINQQPQPVTTRLHAVGITIGMVAFAVGLPIVLPRVIERFMPALLMAFRSPAGNATRYLIDGAVPFFVPTLHWVSSPPDYLMLLDILYLINYIMPLVIPTVLGATFWLAVVRLKRAPFSQVLLEASGAALLIMLIEPLLVQETVTAVAAVTHSYVDAYINIDGGMIGWSSLGNYSDPTNPYLQTLKQFAHVILDWPPIVIIAALLALGCGLLGAGLARGMARWPVVRAAMNNDRQSLRDGLLCAGAIIGMMVFLGLTLPLVLSFPMKMWDLRLVPLRYWRFFPILANGYFLVFPSTAFGVIACIQTLRLNQQIRWALGFAPPTPPIEAERDTTFSVRKVPG